MCAIGRLTLVVLLAAVFGFTAHADEKKTADLKTKLLGKWSGKMAGTSNDVAATIEFKKDDELELEMQIDNISSLKFQGRYSVRDKQVMVSIELNGEKRTDTWKVTALDENRLEYIPGTINEKIVLKRVKK